MKKKDCFLIDKESLKYLMDDKNCKRFIHIINNSKRNKVISKYTNRLYSYIEKKYNYKRIGINFEILELVKTKGGSRYLIKKLK